MRDALELEPLHQSQIVRHPCHGVGQEALGTHGNQDAHQQQEGRKADHEAADGGVDLGQELGLGHDHRELPALEPERRQPDRVAGPADLPDPLRDVLPGPGRAATLAPAARATGSRYGAPGGSFACEAMTTDPSGPTTNERPVRPTAIEPRSCPNRS